VGGESYIQLQGVVKLPVHGRDVHRQRAQVRLIHHRLDHLLAKVRSVSF
jgi:hypothetical protein